MQELTELIRQEPTLRKFFWLIISSAIGALVYTLSLLLSTRVLVPAAFDFFESESLFLFDAIILSSSLIVMLVPGWLLTKVSLSYPAMPTWHLKVAVVSWIFTRDQGFYLIALYMLHVGIWAECVGVIWRNRWADKDPVS